MTNMELIGLEVKPYISSYKNCRPSASGYVMEAQDSILIIDLSHFSNIEKITIISKRISGNGKIKINNLDYEILSKENNHLELNNIQNKIEFIRDNSAIGKIIIANIKIQIKDVENNINPSFIEEKKIPANPDNWRNLLMKCGEVKGIKLINNKLLASEHAFIQKNNLINYLITEPPNCFIRGNGIKFIYPCEIIAISFNDGFSMPPSKPKFKHFDINKNQTFKTQMTENIQNINSEKITNTSNNIIYDSFQSGFNISTLGNINDIIYNQGKNNQGLIMKRYGNFTIPMSSFKPNMQYVIVLNIKKINGNGKIGTEIITTDGIKKSSTLTLATEKETELYLKLNTETPPNPGENYLLRIFRPEEVTVGDILINKIMVINGITLANLHLTKNDSHIINNNSSTTKIINNKEKDLVRASSKFYSRNIFHNKTLPQFDFAGEISLRSQSGVNWFNKISSLCPKLKNVKDAKILISELGSLISSEKIYLNSFYGNISDEDQKILKNCKIIFSPSLQNVELLNKLFPDIKIELIEKSWPSIEPTPIKFLPKEYVVMFHRDKLITDKIISYYKNDYPPLILIGAQEKYEGNIIQLNEYISYDKILNILLNSKMLIDISIYDDYMSGLLSLCFDLGIFVITSNWFGLNKPNCKFIISKDKINELNIPKKNDFKIGFEDALNSNKIEIKINHNEKVNKFLSTLLDR